MSASPAKRTPLFDLHQELRAKMTLFSGWQMPLYYTGIITEHMAVRQKAGLFDISHMGKIEVWGRRATELLEFLLTTKVSTLLPGQVSYTFLCNEKGGIVDDLTIFCFAGDHYFLCVNAICTEKDLEWIKAYARPVDVDVKDSTQDMALLALQGPLAERILDMIIDIPWQKPERFRFVEVSINGENVIISRTGYTGEDGFEFFCSAREAMTLWNEVVKVGRDFDMKLCGLGARNTLRLEMAYVLYGEDISEDITLLEARLERFVDFEKDKFIGKEALWREKEKGCTRQLVGFMMEERGIPRKGYSVFHDQSKVGVITSGTISPILNRGIGLGLIREDLARDGYKAKIGIRDKKCEAKVVLTPFAKLK